MTTSFPFMHVARDTGLRYASVLAIADVLERSGMERCMHAIDAWPQVARVAQALAAERARRAAVASGATLAAAPRPPVASCPPGSRTAG